MAKKAPIKNPYLGFVRVLSNQPGQVVLRLNEYKATFIPTEDLHGIRMISWEKIGSRYLLQNEIPEMHNKALRRVAHIFLGRQRKIILEKIRRQVSPQLSFAFSKTI